MTTTTVTKSETTTARFGRCITYTATLDGVRFTADRVAGLNDFYIVSLHVGRCGHSFRTNLATIPATAGVAARFEKVARALRADPATFTADDHFDASTRSAAMCCDPEACDRFRTFPPRDLTTPTDADLSRADTAGTWAYNTGHPKDWTTVARMRELIPAAEKHTGRARALVETFNRKWQANADYADARERVLA